MGADEKEKADPGEERGSAQALLHQLVLQLSMTQLALVTSGDHLSAAVLEDDILDLARREGVSQAFGSPIVLNSSDTSFAGTSWASKSISRS